MSGRVHVGLPAIIFLTLLLLSRPTAAATGSPPSAIQGSWASSYTSWALGVVVPQGAVLQGGAHLSWTAVENITTVVHLPLIVDPDMPVYAVLSAMTEEGSVLQVAVGLYTNSSAWRCYSDLVTEVGSPSQAYEQLLNGSEPSMPPNATVSLSIFREPTGHWELSVADEKTGFRLSKPFPSVEALSLKGGDQEVFALESYSRSAATFLGMGNLTLESLLVDGSTITGGTYFYSEWDEVHQPLFAVGSDAGSPPGFVSVQKAGDGSFVWSFDDQTWVNDAPPADPDQIVMILVLLGSVTFATGLLALMLIRWPQRRAESEEVAPRPNADSANHEP